MVLRLNKRPLIDNLRRYPVATVEKLRALLAAGAPAQADPRRKNFFELEDDCHVFYIHVAPFKSKVMLLATWEKGCPEAS
jgi:hypothetical protein